MANKSRGFKQKGFLYPGTSPVKYKGPKPKANFFGSELGQTITDSAITSLVGAGVNALTNKLFNKKEKNETTRTASDYSGFSGINFGKNSRSI